MECPLSGSLIQNAMFMKGHFYEKEMLQQLFSKSARCTDPFTRTSVTRSDVVEGGWLNSLRNNIRHLFEEPKVADGAMPRMSPIDTILHEYVQGAKDEAEKQARQTYVTRIRHEWGA